MPRSASVEGRRRAVMTANLETPATLAGAPPTAAAEGPRRIGRYAVLGTLGSGGMGVVYEGYDEQLGRKVAIKRLNHRRGGSSAHGRSLREAQALARLAHPNVVAVHEVLEADEQVFIVMERVAGRTLRAWLAERRPGRADVLEALAQAGRGVAAAHAAGLVHRDFKPDNIMVGDDGRVRVMDFGLARATDTIERDAEVDTTLQSGTNLLIVPVTVAGTQLGTPGYMAPEQYLGLAADARSDIFGFCVVLFEALHGRRPFVGRDTVEVREATLRGRIEPVVGGDVPAWLDAVVRRGLAASPAARWPSMAALLDALARDPIARRRRLARTAGVVTLAGALAAGLSFGYVAREQARARARAEELAAARLVAAEAAIARAEAEGDPAAAEATFRAFVTDPAHRGSRALARAWQRRGDQRRGEPEAAQAAYAEAYVQAQEPADTEAALRGMSAVFHGTWQGPPLGRALALLRARAADDPALADMALDAALWQRDLAGALAELERPGHPRAAWRPMLAHLGGARPTELSVSGLSTLPPGGPARFAVRGADGHEVVLLDGALAEVGRWRGEGREVRLVPGTAWAVTQANGEGAVIDLLSPGTELWRGASPAPVYRAFGFDATGDGAPELLFSRISPHLGFRRLDGLGGPAAGERIAHAGAERGDSVLEDAAAGDLDGDGAPELAVAFGPWQSFDLRLFRAGAGGELEQAARRRLGRIGGLTTVVRGGRRVLAVLTDDSAPAPELFPEPPHTGAPAGLHLFEWTGGALKEVEFVPLPRAGAVARFVARDGECVGDFDGDGREDLALDLLADGRPWTWLLRQTDGGFEPLWLGGVRPLGAAQLDDDAPAELLVELGPEHRLVALGVGDGRLPDLRPQAVPGRPPPAAVRDPLLVERWNRAEDLAAVGLGRSAAASLQEAADLAAEPRARLDLLDRAAELLAALGDDEAVLAVDRRVRDAPWLAPRALARSARARVRLGRYEEALADAEALARAPGRSDEEVALARALQAELSPLVASDARVELGFAGPLAPAWQFHRPGALRRDPTRQTLALTIPTSAGPVAELPIEWDGGPLSLEFELDVERLEYGACVRLAIVDAAGEPWLGGGFCSMGGGGRLMQIGRWKAGEGGWHDLRSLAVASAAHRRRVVVRVAYFPERGVAECSLDDGEGVQRHTAVDVAPARPGRYRLAIGAFAPDLSPTLAEGDLRRVVLRGARSVAAPAEVVAREHPARMLAENEPLKALAALAESTAPHPRADMIRLLARDQLGEVAGVVAAAPAVLAHMHEETWLADLGLALRARPLAGAVLREAAGPALLPVLGATWSLLHPHRDDPEIRRRALVELQGLEALAPTGAEERLALRRLLLARGRLWARSGDRERARRDLEAAVTLPSVEDELGEDRTQLVLVHLELARLLAREAPTLARAHAGAALRLTASPEETRDRLLADPDVASHAEVDASWRELLMR